MSIFTTAKPIAAPVKKTKANTRASYTVVGLALLSALVALEKLIGTLKAMTDAKVKATAMDLFVDEALATGTVPESFSLVDRGSIGTAIFAKRSSASALPLEVVNKLHGYGIPTEVNIKTKRAFIFKQSILEDEALAQEISDTLMANPRLAGLDLVELQEEVKTDIVSDESIKVAVKVITNRRDLMAVVQDLVTQRINTKFGGSEADAFSLVNEEYNLPVPVVVEVVSIPALPAAVNL